jgi:hypothetical protein
MKAPECAGCHNFIGQTTNRQNASCMACHTAPLPGHVDPADEAQTMQVARKQVQARDEETKIFAADKIPETVTIGTLSKRFEPSVMPHRQMVNALVNKTRNSKLAGYFHTEKGHCARVAITIVPRRKNPPRAAAATGRRSRGPTRSGPGYQAPTTSSASAVIRPWASRSRPPGTAMAAMWKKIKPQVEGEPCLFPGENFSVGSARRA